MAPTFPVRQADLQTLASLASAYGLPALAGSAWDYDVGPVGWLGSTLAPGPLNRIRRDLFTALRHIETTWHLSGGLWVNSAVDRGWPESTLVSGPWVLTPAVIAAANPGEGHLPETDWPGIIVSAAGVFASFKDCRVIANEPFALRTRCDVDNSEIGSGWAGSYDETYGWVSSLAFTISIAPAADIVPRAGTAAGVVWVELPGLPTTMDVTLNGSPVSVSAEALSGGTYRWTVDVTGTSQSGLAVTFDWDDATLGATAWLASFTVEYEYGDAAAYGACLAVSGYSAAASPDFRVTAAGGWQAGVIYLWPEFDHGPEDPYDEQWCIVAMSLPITRLLWSDFPSPNRLAPAWTLAPGGEVSGAWRPACPSAPMERWTASAAADPELRLVLDDVTKPSFLSPATGGMPISQPVYSLPGFWVCRSGKSYHHAPILRDVPAEDATRPVAGPEITVEVGLWDETADDSFRILATYTLPETTAYAWVPFDLPVPVLENLAVVWRATPASGVFVTAPVVVQISLPDGSSPASWDAAWSGDTASAIPRGSGGYPATGNDPSGPWIDYPPAAWNSAPAAALIGDPLRILGA